MPKPLFIKRLDRIAIAGVGLLGGSVGLALRAAGYQGSLVGIGRRASSLQRALAAGAVDITTMDPAEGVDGAGAVIICTPLKHYERLLRQMAPALGKGAIVTDVGSAKVEAVRLGERILPDRVRFVGSHPMAGSEQTGVEYARADLFQRALCLVTPTPRTPPPAVTWARQFWTLLGGRPLVLDPARHDELLADASHLPHAVATAVVNVAARSGGIRLAGPGFADATRIASGDAEMWADILLTNRRSMLRSLDTLVKELSLLRRHLDKGDTAKLQDWLAAAKLARDAWISERYRKKVLPP